MPPNSFIETASFQGKRLRVEFAWQGDRFGHRIVLIEGDEFRPLLTSVEGTVADTWPTSPVLQNLHLEPRDGNRQVALLVGMGGRSHWSMSVEPDATSATIDFDLACRVGGHEPRLQTTYQVEGDVARICVAAEGASSVDQSVDRQLTISPAHRQATTRWRYRVLFNW